MNLLRNTNSIWPYLILFVVLSVVFKALTYTPIEPLVVNLSLISTVGLLTLTIVFLFHVFDFMEEAKKGPEALERQREVNEMTYKLLCLRNTGDEKTDKILHVIRLFLVVSLALLSSVSVVN